MLSPMFVVTEAEAAAIRAVYEQRGELSAAVELRRLFPGITDNAQARECARAIAGWKPRPLQELPKRPRLPAGGLTGGRLPMATQSGQAAVVSAASAFAANQ